MVTYPVVDTSRKFAMAIRLQCLQKFKIFLCYNSNMCILIWLRSTLCCSGFCTHSHLFKLGKNLLSITSALQVHVNLRLCCSWSLEGAISSRSSSRSHTLFTPNSFSKMGERLGRPVGIENHISKPKFWETNFIKY